MAIELVTGGNGSGKTAYTVGERLTSELGRKFPLDAETCLKLGYELGTVVERRICAAGVRGLLLEHERLPHVLTRDAPKQAEVDSWNACRGDDTRVPFHQRNPDEPPRTDVPMLLENWWLWVKPGDLLVCDESQYVAPKASSGRALPFWIEHLATHRHYGVDWLFITPHPMLISDGIRRLVTLHRHIRSVLGSGLCTVYAWDHCSSVEKITQSTKSVFVRRAKHYRLYNSSSLHTAPPATGRKPLLLVPLLLAGVWFSASSVIGRHSASESKAVASLPAPGGSVSGAAGGGSYVPGPGGPMFVPFGLPSQVVKASGCYAVGSQCSCFDQSGRPMLTSADLCRLSSRSFDGLVAWEARRTPPPDALPRSPSAPSPSASAAGLGALLGHPKGPT